MHNTEKDGEVVMLLGLLAVPTNVLLIRGKHSYRVPPRADWHTPGLNLGSSLGGSSEEAPRSAGETEVVRCDAVVCIFAISARVVRLCFCCDLQTSDALDAPRKYSDRNSNRNSSNSAFF
jgi:hypothetical protein